jgi:hypothetical protein
MLIKIVNSYIYTEIDIYYVNSYIHYIIELLKITIVKNNLQINIIIGNSFYNFNNDNKLIKININWEHTLVKKNGRSIMPNCLEGKVLTNTGEPYLVRIDKYEELSNADIIIDYSIPNIYNIYSSNNYNIFFKKMVYISPVLFDYDLQNYKTNREINILTTFINTNEPRRRTLLDNIKSYNLDHTNINNCFDTIDLKNLYLNTKILINIHQTEHHSTFEELRVLPALLSGVIVISELSPLNTLIPYNDFIIWSSYDNIIRTVNTIINNYDENHTKIFKSKNLLSVLHKNNISKMENMIITQFN